MLKTLYIAALMFFFLPASGRADEQVGYRESDEQAASIQKSDAQYPYGTKARLTGQDRYFKDMGHDNYISQQQNWEEKLKVRKKQFNNLLQRDYMKMVGDLAKQKDYSDSSFFRRKAITAKRSDFDLVPEDPSKWNVKDDAELEVLRKTRLELLDTMVGYTPVVAPAETAKAIVSYDCWVQQAQKKMGQENSQDCRRQYEESYKYIAKISGNIKDKDLAEINNEYHWVDIIDPIVPLKQVTEVSTRPIAPPELKKPKGKPGVNAKQAAKSSTASKSLKQAVVDPKFIGPLPASVSNGVSQIQDQSNSSPDLVYIAYFSGKESELTEQAKTELDKTVGQIKADKPTSIIINGHTDRSFASTESLILSKVRADAAKSYLVSKGVPASIIKTYGFGKTDNIVDNAEGQAVPANNRAEVSFKGKIN